MKSFITAMLFFILTVTAVAVNSHIIRGKITEICGILEICDGDIGTAREISDSDRTLSFKALGLWEDCRRYLSLSVQRSLIRDVNESFGMMVSACDADSSADFLIARSSIIARLSHILQRESLTFTAYF